MAKARKFLIYLSTGQIRQVAATSLRVALQKSGADDDKVKILAGIDAACVPAPKGDEHPFCAVLLANPRFIIPE